MIVTNEMVAHQVDYLCDWCHKGHMRSTGVTLTVNPPMYPHRCDNHQCQRSLTMNRSYPFIEYRKKEPKEKRRRESNAGSSRSG